MENHRRHRILFVGESVTLAHVARPYALCQKAGSLVSHDCENAAQHQDPASVVMWLTLLK
jgi:hypothetical protein